MLTRTATATAIFSALACGALVGCQPEAAAPEPTLQMLRASCAPPSLAPPPPPPPRVETPQPPAPQKPDERTVALGRSVLGTPLTLHVFGQSGPAVFILGGIHGDEPASAAVAECLLDCLRTDRSLSDGRQVALLARANPDGLGASTRANSHGVDLNRNFPAANWLRSKVGRTYGGASPACEPETQAIIQAVRTLRPQAIVSVHAISGGRHCNNWDGPAEALARRMASRNGYPPTPTIGYPTPGSLGSWAGVDQKIAMVTLELPSSLTGEECWRANRQALLEAIRFVPPTETPSLGK